MTAAEVRTMAAALQAIETELRAKDPKGRMDRAAHVAFVAAWSTLNRHAQRLARKRAA